MKIITVKPTIDQPYGTTYYQVYVNLEQFNAVATIDDWFEVEIGYCETDIDSAPEFVPNPEIFVIDHDYNRVIKVPEFSLTNPNCPYTLGLRAWIP